MKGGAVLFEGLWQESEAQQRQKLLEVQLAKVIERHLFVQVRLDKTQEVQRSMLLSLDSKQHCLWLDQLMPRVGLSRLHDAFWTVSWRDQGVMWRFQSRLLEVKGKFPDQTYKLAMPEKLLHHQRRGAFRVQLHHDQVVPVLICLPGGKRFKGDLNDLSATGLSASFTEPELSGLLPRGVKIEPCLIGLPDSGTVEVRLEVVKVEVTEQGEFQLCGKMEVQNPRARHQLERFIASIQRSEQRKLRGLE